MQVWIAVSSAPALSCAFYVCAAFTKKKRGEEKPGNSRTEGETGLGKPVYVSFCEWGGVVGCVVGAVSGRCDPPAATL